MRRLAVDESRQQRQVEKLPKRSIPRMPSAHQLSTSLAAEAFSSYFILLFLITLSLIFLLLLLFLTKIKVF